MATEKSVYSDLPIPPETRAKTFDKGKLKKALKDIRALSTKAAAESIPKLKALLGRHGVILVLLPQFPNIPRVSRRSG